LEEDDKYYNNKYKLKLSVQRVEKIDNYWYYWFWRLLWDIW
jgi:hypothetical protein